MSNFKEYVLEKAKTLKVKSTKEKAGYIDHPKNGEVCKHCTMWRPPNACSAVAGVISPDGWCEWYKRTHRKDRE
jgi:coenzyme F420-reducing hydrogenase beta subunit